MNKHLIVILFALLFCNTLTAQPPGVSGFRLYDRDYKVCIGIKGGGGMTMTTPSTSYNFNPKGSFTYQGGLVLNAHFGRRNRFGFGGGGTGWFGAQMEVLYSNRGMKYNNTTMNMSCIEVPVLLQVYPFTELGIELGATIVKMLNFTPNVTPTDYAFIHTGQIKGGDVMLTAGICYKASFGLLIDARYNMGFSSIAGNLDTKVSTATLSIGYLFNMIK